MEALEVGVVSWCLGADDVAAACRIAREELDVGVMQAGFFGSEAVAKADVEAILAACRTHRIELSAAFVLFDDEKYANIAEAAAVVGFTPDDAWERKLALFTDAVALTGRLGLERLSIHSGRAPAESEEDAIGKMLERVGRAADIAAEKNVRLLLETGQEPAGDLKAFIMRLDRPNVGVNLDSGNFVMYGTGDPVKAVREFGDQIEHVHLKDAFKSAAPAEEWAEETTLGNGDANIPRLASKLRAGGYRGPLVVERSRRRSLAEVRESIDWLRRLF